MEHTTRRGVPARGLAVLVTLLGVLVAGLLVAAVSNADAQVTPDNPPNRAYALTDDDRLILFDGNRPSQTLARRPVTGLAPGDTLVGIDFRPRGDNLIYGVADGTTTDKIYTIEPNTGAATILSNLTVQLEGRRFGVDFNPVPDRLRVVSNTGQNLRINVDDGATTVDGRLNYAAGDPNAGKAPGVTGVAYTNNIPPSPRTADPNVPGTGTTLYDIDARLDVLAIQNPPNDGTLNTRGRLGVNVEGINGFDIVTSGTTTANTVNRAFAILQPNNSNSSSFYSVNLNTGKVKNLGRLNGRGSDIEGLAIPIGQP